MNLNRRGELFRDPKNGKIAGVCAGLANYFGWETWLVRILVVSGVLLGMGWFIVIYIAGWFILDKKPNQPMQASNEANKSRFHKQADTKNAHYNQQNEDIVNESIKVKAKIWQAGEPPKQAFHDIRKKFNVLEGKLRDMEHYVTSPEFTVSREINKL
jgi:phage shock protein C